MPTYDYQCNACGHKFELFQQMSDSVKRKCPKCGKPKLERLIGIGAGVLFKGGGFYETDYRSGGYTKAAEAEKKAAEGKSEPAKTEASTTADSDGKAESKTESKKDSKPDSRSETAGTKSDRSAAKSASESSSASKSAPRGVKSPGKRAPATAKKRPRR